MRKVLVTILLMIVLIPLQADAEQFERYPAIQIEGIFYSVDCLCVDGQNVRHRDKSKNIVRPIVKEERLCKKWDAKPENGGTCLVWDAIEKACPLKYTVRVYEVNVETEKLVEIKTYRIPKCGYE